MSNQQAMPPAGPVAGQASGFELASPDQLDAANIETALARNQAFAAAAATRTPSYFPTCGCS